MRLVVNGAVHELPARGSESLIELLRERLQLTGTKQVCDRAECGACTVLVNGTPVYACITLAAACEGTVVTTIEGLGTPESLHPLQRAFIEQDALQCGFCTPGQILAALALLREHIDPDDEAIAQGMSGNLCRCGTYPGIVRAIRAAGRVMRDTTRADPGPSHRMEPGP